MIEIPEGISHVTRPMAALALGVSNQAIHDRIKKGRLATVEILGEVLIPSWAVREAIKRKEERWKKKSK